MFAKITAAFAAGVSVDTVLTGQPTVPGGTLHGEVRFTAGRVDYTVQATTLGFHAEDRGDQVQRFPFHRARVSDRFVLRPGDNRTIPFRTTLPAETPVCTVSGHRLPDLRLGVTTELALEHALDKSDSDPVWTIPSPAQETVTTALHALGFSFDRARLAAGAPPGSAMPFHQEIRYWPTGEFRQLFTSVSLGFVTGVDGLRVLVDADRPTGALSHAAAVDLAVDGLDSHAVAGALRDRLHELATRRPPAGG